MIKEKFFVLLLILSFVYGCRSQAEILYNGNIKTLYSSTKSFADCIPSEKCYFSNDSDINKSIQKRMDEELQKLKFIENHPMITHLVRYNNKLKMYNILVENADETGDSNVYIIDAFVKFEKQSPLFTQIVMRVHNSVEYEILNLSKKVKKYDKDISLCDWQISHYGDQYRRRIVTKKVQDGYKTVTYTKNDKTYTETKPKYHNVTETVIEPNPDYNPSLANNARTKLGQIITEQNNCKYKIESLSNSIVSFEQTVTDRKINCDKL